MEAASVLQKAIRQRKGTGRSGGGTSRAFVTIGRDPPGRFAQGEQPHVTKWVRKHTRCGIARFDRSSPHL